MTMGTQNPPHEAAATLADLVMLPRVAPVVRDLILVLAGAALAALAAQVAFTAPWTPVPYTLQTGAVLLVGTALGTWRGGLSMLVYVLAGTVGLPVYAEGAAGLDRLLGATGGYLLAFIVAAVIVGRLAELRWDRSIPRAAALMLIGTAVIYAIGVPVLMLVLEMPPADAAWNGALVFVPWDLFKVALAAGLLPFAWWVAGRR